MNSISNTVSTISQNTFSDNWRQVLFVLKKFLQIYVLLNIIDYDLINKFSL